MPGNAQPEQGSWRSHCGEVPVSKPLRPPARRPSTYANLAVAVKDAVMSKGREGGERVGKEESRRWRRWNEAKEDGHQLRGALGGRGGQTHRQWSHTVALDLVFAAADPLGGDAEDGPAFECLPRLAGCSGSGEPLVVIVAEYGGSTVAAQVCWGGERAGTRERRGGTSPARPERRMTTVGVRADAGATFLESS